MSESGMHEAVRELKEYREPIDRALSGRYEDLLDDSHGSPGDVVFEQDVIMANLARTRGKRMRGALLMAAYAGFGGEDYEVALKAAVADEESQLSLLAFDDFMDEANKRRGMPTPHVQWSGYVEKQWELGEPAAARHLANSLAVNTANILAHRAVMTFAALPGVPAERIIRAIQIHGQNMVRTGEGQARDLVNPYDFDLTEKEIEQTHIDKTAYYTFINPMQIGACLAGASEDDLADFEVLGAHMGLAYQYKDDLLDMFGDPSVTGKPVFEDLQEGKMTLLLHYMLHNASEEDKLALTALRGRQITEEQQPIIRRILRRRHGPAGMSAERYVEEKAHDSIEAARKVIDGHPEWKPEFSGFLRNLLSYIILRNS